MAAAPDQRTYLLDVLARTGWNQTELAKRAGLDPSTLSRFLSSARPGLSLRLSTIRRIAQVTGLPFDGVPEAAHDAAGLAEAEAQPLTEDAPPLTAAILDSLRANGSAIDAWTLRSRALELAGYRPGDILFVKLGASPLKGDVVCTQIYDWAAGRTETVFRIFEPPFLISATADTALFAPYPLDDDRVAIKGTVLHSLRSK